MRRRKNGKTNIKTICGRSVGNAQKESNFWIGGSSHSIVCDF